MTNVSATKTQKNCFYQHYNFLDKPHLLALAPILSSNASDNFTDKRKTGEKMFRFYLFLFR
jgi:hypothetical protein